MKHNRRIRQEEAIKRLEKTLAMHEANTELTVAIMEDKKMSTGAADKVESIRQHKIKSAKTTIENTIGKALHTPGHTPGSMCFLFERQKLLIAGDTLFQGSIGRTDLWGGDYSKIEQSIQGELYTLDEETNVITGHGESTTIGREMRSNNFVRA